MSLHVYKQATAKDVHPCPTPTVGAGHNKPPKGWQEGAVYACECGLFYALRNRWNYAGDWWEWDAVTLASARVEVDR